MVKHASEFTLFELVPGGDLEFVQVCLAFLQALPGPETKSESPEPDIAWALTGRKVAKQKEFSSAYQLANIQIFCTGQGSSISIDHSSMWSMDSRFVGSRYLKIPETRNNG